MTSRCSKGWRHSWKREAMTDFDLLGYRSIYKRCRKCDMRVMREEGGDCHLLGWSLEHELSIAEYEMTVKAVKEELEMRKGKLKP